MDLVEVAADVRPPVCRIMDFGKFKYEQSKKDKASKAKSKTTELKEIRLGRSMKIDPHDVAIRLKKAREFLMEGHKVQIVQQFKGREMQHRSRGDVRMREIITQLADIGKVEVPPRMMGRRMSMIIGPDKAKVDQLKRKLEREQKKQPAVSSDGSMAAEAVKAPAPPTRTSKKSKPVATPVEQEETVASVRS